MIPTPTTDWGQWLEDDDSRLLLAQYASEMPERVKLLRQALTTRDYTWLQRLSHQIKGSAGLYGFPQLAAKAGELENLLREKSCDAVVIAAANAVIELCREPQAQLEQQFQG